jgi:hypothetical protein
MDQNIIQPVKIVSDAPAYAKIFGILALIASIAALLIPFIGVLVITPLAIIFGAIALFGGAKGFGIASLIIIVVNIIISPTFWINIYAGASQAGAVGNRLITYFDALGIILMFGLVVFKRGK